MVGAVVALGGCSSTATQANHGAPADASVIGDASAAFAAGNADDRPDALTGAGRVGRVKMPRPWLGSTCVARSRRSRRIRRSAAKSGRLSESRRTLRALARPRPHPDGGWPHLVLTGVPANAELIVTAEKTGYRSSVCCGDHGACLTRMSRGRTTGFIPDKKTSSSWTRSPAAPSSGTGDLSVFSIDRPHRPESRELPTARRRAGLPSTAQTTAATSCPPLDRSTGRGHAGVQRALDHQRRPF